MKRVIAASAAALRLASRATPGIEGAVESKAVADMKHLDIVSNCLTGRGYKVLG